MTDAREIISSDGKALIAEAITEYFGERCPDFEGTCACCKAWASWDRILGPDEADQLRDDIQVAIISVTGDCEASHKIAMNHLDRAIHSIGRKT